MSEAPCAAALALCQKAARLLTGAKRRAFQAECATSFCAGSARRAETLFGWRRETVSLGLQEARSGIVCLYEKGVQVTGRARRALEARWQRSPTLRWWDILIEPRKG